MRRGGFNAGGLGKSGGFIAGGALAPVTITPTSATKAPRATQSFSASGGTGTGYVWSLGTNASGGSIDASTGAYTAGSTGGVTDVVHLVDSLANSANANVSVTAGVSIAPSSASVAPRGSQTFTASGGSGTGYTWSLGTNASGGSINASTGVYTAGATGNVTDVVHVVDSLGNVANRNVSVTAGVSISPSSLSAVTRGTQTFSASGGSGTGFVWSLSTNNSGGSIDASTGAYAAGATGNVTDVVTATDSLGNTKTASVAVAWRDPITLLGAALTTYLHADTLAGANGSTVSPWTDGGAAGTNATAPGGATAGPTLQTTGLNGKKCVTSDGTQGLQTSASIPLSTTNVVTVFAVLKGSLAAFAEIAEYTPSAGANAGFNLAADTLGDAASIGVSVGPPTGVDQVSAASQSLTTPAVLVVKIDRSLGHNTATIRKDRVALTTSNNIVGNTSGNFAASTLYLFHRSGGSFKWNGSLRVFGIVKRALTAEEQSNLEGWLSVDSGTP